MTRKMSALEARRQLSFLKSFDRKFQVLDRELQRLNRARDARTTSPSGWPIDGLERTVKSLIGAGAVYGLADISTWAREFLDALGRIRARKTALPQEDMDWLADRIRVLEKMQHDAMERAEETISGRRDSNPEPNGESAEEDTWKSALADAETEENVDGIAERKARLADAAHRFSQKKAPKPASLPRIRGADVTGKPASTVQKIKGAPGGTPVKSTKASAATTALFPENAPHVLEKASNGAPPVPVSDVLSSKPTDDGAENREHSADHDDNDDFVGSSDTMPVDIIDIVDVSEKVGLPRGDANGKSVVDSPPAPTSASERTGGKRRTLWPLAAGVLLLALGVSLYFNFVGKARESETKSPAATTDSSGPSTEAQGDSAAPVSDSAAALAVDDMTDTTSDTGDTVDSSSVEPSPDTGKSRTRAARNRGGRKAARKKTTAAQTSSPTDNAAKSSEAKSNENATGQSTGTSSTKSDDGPTGRLRISMPAGATGEIRIFVDGQKKGKAPRILSLSAGLHEVRFEMDGKSKLKIVSIKTGVTSDVTPRF